MSLDFYYNLRKSKHCMVRDYPYLLCIMKFLNLIPVIPLFKLKLNWFGLDNVTVTVRSLQFEITSSSLIIMFIWYHVSKDA